MDYALAAATVVAAIIAFLGALLGGYVGARRAARITARGTTEAAEIAAAAAKAIAQVTSADAAASREADRRAWINERCQELASELLIVAEQHRRDVRAQQQRWVLAALLEGPEEGIPAIGSTTPIRELAWRLSLVADEPVFQAAYKLYRSTVELDQHLYDPVLHKGDGKVLPIPADLRDAQELAFSHFVESRNRFRNGFRSQVGQSPLDQVDPFDELVDEAMDEVLGRG